MSRKRRLSKQTGPVEEADRSLAFEQFSDLNRAFYEGFNVEAFEIRLMILCLSHDSPERLVPLFKEGVSWEKLQLASDVQQQDVMEFAELELLSLHHHLAETVTRVFWVHAHGVPCPWLALARLRSPGELKEVAKKYLRGDPWKDEESRRNGHGDVLYACKDLAGAKDKRLGPSVDRAMEWLEVAAQTVLESPMYNAYKHGLAILPSPSFELAIGESDGDRIEMAGGRGYEYLSLERPDTGLRRWRWYRKRDYVDFAGKAAECALLLLLLRSILITGAFVRRVSESAEHQLFQPEITPSFAATKVGAPYFATGFSEELLYYREGIR